MLNIKKANPFKLWPNRGSQSQTFQFRDNLPEKKQSIETFKLETQMKLVLKEMRVNIDFCWSLGQFWATLTCERLQGQKLNREFPHRMIFKKYKASDWSYHGGSGTKNYMETSIQKSRNTNNINLFSLFFSDVLSANEKISDFVIGKLP